MPKKNPFEKIVQQIQQDSARATGSMVALDTLDKQRLRALYLVSQQLNTILDPDRLFREVIKKIVELLRAERAVIVLRENGELRIRIAHNSDDQSEQNALIFSRSIVSRVMKEYQPLFSTNAIDDSRFSQYQTIQELEILSFICVPILVDDEVIGTIYVDNRHLTSVFTEADVEFLQAFSNLIGIAIRNSLAYHQIEELNQSLEMKVRERTAELRRTIEELQATQERLIQSEKMASLGRLIAGFVHEFNNPINFIYSNLPHLESYTAQLMESIETVLSRLSEEERKQIEEKYDLTYLRTDLQKLIEGLKEGARRSTRLVQDLRDFSTSPPSAFQLINWNENLAFVARIFRERQQNPVEVELRGEEPLFIKGNRTEINQALLNLLGNAVDAGATRIQITSSREGNRLKCRIRDNGSGISREDIPRIFDPFFTTKEVGKGMGLGLSIVYNIISHHRGKIDVESVPGKGTTFTLFLPLAD